MAYFAKDEGHGPMVAMDHVILGSIAICECLTIGAAMREADRLNMEHRAHQARAQRTAKAYYGQRRSVRYFANEDGPEDFHG